MNPSGLFWVDSSFGSLIGMRSLIVISATDFAEPQPPTGPLYGLILDDGIFDVISAQPSDVYERFRSSNSPAARMCRGQGKICDFLAATDRLREVVSVSNVVDAQLRDGLALVAMEPHVSDTGSEAGNSVRVEQIDGQWVVQVLEDGDVTQRLFENEQFANNFAEGQRLRLNRQAAISQPGLTPTL